MNEVSRNARFYIVSTDPFDVLLVEPFEDVSETHVAKIAQSEDDFIYFYVNPPAPRFQVSNTGERWVVLDYGQGDARGVAVAQLYGPEGERLIRKVADTLNNGWKKEADDA